MIRIDALWLALGANDLRGGIDRLLAQVLCSFDSARAHHAYVFANRRADRLKVLVYGKRPANTTCVHTEDLLKSRQAEGAPARSRAARSRLRRCAS
jgi:hypothetical protein